MDMVYSVLQHIETFLTTPSLTRAIVGGCLTAVAGAQWFKRWLWPALGLPVSDAIERLVIVSLAFAIGFWVTSGLGGGFFLALIVGFANPALYTIATKVIYHQWPWLESKLSASPRKVVQTPEGFEERDVTAPSKPGEKTVFYRKD